MPLMVTYVYTFFSSVYLLDNTFPTIYLLYPTMHISEVMGTEKIVLANYYIDYLYNFEETPMII